MLKRISVSPLAAESLGVRSMCVFVETPDVKVLLDAGVSLCPNRFGLPPHPLEFEAIEAARKRIAEAADKADVVTLSHYHFDHHTPFFEDKLCNWTEKDETARQIYGGKMVLVKDARENINYSQRRRGWMFKKTSGKYASKLEIADGKEFSFGKSTRVKFSKPVFHGSENSALGWVLMSTIEYEDERFLFAPDVQGPMLDSTVKMIMRERAQLIMIGGPPSYLAGFRVDEKLINAGFVNLGKLAENGRCIVLEHHVLRDEDWREKAKSVFEKADKAGCEVFTAAELLSEENVFLEAGRKRLFAEQPPGKEFRKWVNGIVRARKRKEPMF